MKKRVVFLISISTVLFVLTGVAMPAQKGPATVAEIALYKGYDRQQIIEEGARREGKLTFYTSGILTQAVRPIVDAFQKKYPFVKVEIWRADAKALISRIIEEYKVGKHLADVIECTQVGRTMLQNAGVFQPFYSPNLSSIEEDAIRVAPGESAFAAAFRESGHSMGYNTKSISREELPKTYRDLLHPKWKGKVALAGSENGVFWAGTMLETYGEEFVKQMAQQNFDVHMVSARAILDMIINGEYVLSPTITDAHVIESKKKGAPVEWVPLEPVHVNVGQIALLKNSPNPHAALLLIDFELSKEVGEIQIATGYRSTRKDLMAGKPYRKNYGPMSAEEAIKWDNLFDRLFLKK